MFFIELYLSQACVMLEGLNRGLPQLGIGKSSKHKKTLQQLQGQTHFESSDPL